MKETARGYFALERVHLIHGLHWHPARNIVHIEQCGGFWVACGHDVIVAVVADEESMISKRGTPTGWLWAVFAIMLISWIITWLWASSVCPLFPLITRFLIILPAVSPKSDSPRRSVHYPWSSNFHLLPDGVRPVGNRSLRARVTCDVSDLGMFSLLSLGSFSSFPPVSSRHPADDQHASSAPCTPNSHHVRHQRGSLRSHFYLWVGRHRIPRCLRSLCPWRDQFPVHKFPWFSWGAFVVYMRPHKCWLTCLLYISIHLLDVIRDAKYAHPDFRTGFSVGATHLTVISFSYPVCVHLSGSCDTASATACYAILDILSMPVFLIGFLFYVSGSATNKLVRSRAA